MLNSSQAVEKRTKAYYSKLAAGPVTALLSFSLLQPALSVSAAITAGITLWCVLWWILEPIPIPATSLIPIALFPLLGVLSPAQVGQAYGSPLILLMLGGFILSKAMESTGTHRRLALYMVSLSRRCTGSDSDRSIIVGFMLASATLSMWISNTATSLMLLPVALAVISKSKDPNLATPLLIGIAYAASIGGVATPIGSPTNLAFMTIFNASVGEEVSFFEWMTWGLPVTVIMLPIAAMWLTRSLNFSGQLELPQVGSWTAAEKRVLVIFVVTVLLWVTRKDPWGGWTELLGLAYSNDAMVAFCAITLLFIVPNNEGGKLLDWESASQIPWGTLILFGAGLSIAQAFTSSGLSSIIGSALEGIALFPLLMIIGIICFCVTFLTEVTSNTATTTLLMPIMAAAAMGAAIDPKLLMVPAAMSASCAFMLPVATPPNIVIFSTGAFSAKTLVSEGFTMNLVGIVVITLTCYMVIG